ncbi:protein PIF-like [Saccostrea cucullata]|uniref:protein PIF-like n=1 Tax=Saccostrea cuccullata TaxID=36930 RepID=UPI002ED494C9
MYERNFNGSDLKDCDLVDVVFVLPGSDDVTLPHFQILKRLVMLLLRGMSIDESETRLSVVTYGSKVGTVIPLSGNRLLMGRSVMNLQKIGGSSKPLTGLEKAQSLLANNKRYAVPQVAILLYKNVTKKMQKEIREVADDMREQNIRIISIGIGSDNFADLAWTKEQAYRFETIEALSNAIRQIPNYICEAILATKPTRKPPLPKSANERTKTQEEQESSENDEDSNICEEATWVHDVGYAPVKGDIGRFAMCYKGLGLSMKVSYKTCPFGQYWSSSDVTCIQFSRLNLPNDPCRNKTRSSYTYFGMGCSAYWYCDDGKSVPKCCPSKMSYREDAWCVLDPSCTSKCPSSEIGGKGTKTSCDLKAIPGVPNKFQQKTLEGIWKEFKCAEGTVFSEDDCGCARFSVSQYRARQRKDSESCSPELYLPFCDGIKDFSGKETYVGSHGQVWVHDGKAYFDGNSSLFIPRFAGLDYGFTVVIKLKYLADEEDEGKDREADSNHDDDDDNGDDKNAYALISNGNCYGSSCEQPSISITSTGSFTSFSVNRYNENPTIVSRRKRAVDESNNVDSFDDDVENNLDLKVETSEVEDNVNSLDTDDIIQRELNADRNETAATTKKGSYEVKLPDSLLHMDVGFKINQNDTEISDLLKKITLYDIILGSPDDIIDIEIPTTNVPLKIDDTKNNENENTMNIDENELNGKISVTNTTYVNVANTIENTDSNLDLLNEKDVDNSNYDLIFTNGESNGITRIINDIKGVVLNNNAQINQNDNTVDGSIIIAQESENTFLINGQEEDDMSSNASLQPDDKTSNQADASSNNAPETDDIPIVITLGPGEISSNNALEQYETTANKVSDSDVILSNNSLQPDDVLLDNTLVIEDTSSENALEKDLISKKLVQPDNILLNNSLGQDDVLSTELQETDDKSSITSPEADDVLSNNVDIPKDILTKASTFKTRVVNIEPDEDNIGDEVESRESLKTEEISEKDTEINESTEVHYEVVNEDTGLIAEINNLTHVKTIEGDNLNGTKEVLSVTREDDNVDDIKEVPPVTNREDDNVDDTKEVPPVITREDDNVDDTKEVPSVTSREDDNADDTKEVPSVTNREGDNVDDTKEVPPVTTREDGNVDDTKEVPSVTNRESDNVDDTEEVPPVTIRENANVDDTKDVLSVTNREGDNVDDTEEVPSVTSREGDNVDDTKEVPSITNREGDNVDDAKEVPLVTNREGDNVDDTKDVPSVTNREGDNVDDTKEVPPVDKQFPDISTDKKQGNSNEVSESLSNVSKTVDNIETEDILSVKGSNLPKGIISGDFVTHSLTNEKSPGAKSTETDDLRKSNDREDKRKKNGSVNNKKKEKIRKWKTISLKIKDGIMQVTSDGIKKDKVYLKGAFGLTTGSGLHIGSGTGFRNFKGYMDEIYVYLCDPDNNKLEERQGLHADVPKTTKLSANCDYINPKAYDWLNNRK